MPKSKLFVTMLLAAAFVASTAMAVPKPVKKVFGDDGRVTQLSHPGRYSRDLPGRDEDDFMTFRYMKSTDGGDNWSEIMGTGDTGMWELNNDGDTVSAWGEASYDFGAVVGRNNSLHFVAVLNAYSDIRNQGRVNGVYDVRVGENGNLSYNLIAREEGGTFTWSDAGVDRDNNIYAIWVKAVNDSTAEIWAAKSTNNGSSWGNMVRLVADADPTYNFPHMTYHVGEFFYVIFERPNLDTGVYDHYIVKMAASMQGNPTIVNPQAASGVYFSYYVGSVNAIDQDWNNGQVYFSVRSENNAATIVGSSTGGDWTIERLNGAQRYPGVALDQGGNNGTPWVFSNFGPPAADTYHKNWLTYDESGYNGGNWILPPMVLDSVLYNGVRYLLYCHQGVWTSSGRLISGCNVWGQFTPEGYQINVSDDGGANWQGPQELWSFDDGLRGGYIAQNIILAGQSDNVFVAFCGQYGATDFDAPSISDMTLSSVRRGEPWIVTAELNDESGIDYTDVNWLKVGAEEWDFAEADSGMVDDDDNGTYYYTMPSDSMNGMALADGDSVWFFVFARDGVGNLGFGLEGLIIVGREWQGVTNPVFIPSETTLGVNYPNPFNSETVIPYTLNRSQKVTLQIWDTNGRLVETLYDGRQVAGHHSVSWKATGVPTGLYIYTMKTSAGVTLSGKLTILR